MDPMELAPLAQEITPPPPEFSVLPDEIQPPSEEMADLVEGITPPIEEFTHKADEPAAKKKSLFKRLRKLMYGTTAALLSVAVAGGSGVFSHSSAGSANGPKIDFSYAYLVYDYVAGELSPQVVYKYSIDRNDIMWPVSVYTELSDANGTTVSPSGGPDVWESSRAAFDYTIDAAQLDVSTDMELTLTAEYKVGNDTRQLSLTAPVDKSHEQGTPIISIERAEGFFDPQTGDTTAKVKYSVVFNGAEIPMKAYVKVVDSLGQEVQSETWPEWWGSEPASGEHEIDISRLVGGSTTNLNMNLVITLEYQRGGETLEASEIQGFTVQRAAEIKDFKAPEVIIDSAVYVPEGDGMIEHVAFRYHVIRNDAVGRIIILPYVSDSAGYAPPSTDPYFYEQESGEAEGNAFYGGDSHEGWVLKALVLYDENGTQKDFPVTAPVDMSAYTEPSGIDEPVQTYPLADGNIILTVYNNSFNGQKANDPVFPYLDILMHETIKESDWADITLPDPYDPNTDFDPFGFVLHIGSPFDLGFDAEAANAGSAESGGMISLASGRAYPLAGNILTKELVELVPPDANGDRYVNVHVVWMCVVPQETKLPLELDFGDYTDIFEADTPYASEGFFYLSTFDGELKDNAPEGKTFDGWYDDAGRRYEFLSYYDFFPLLEGAESNEDRDWSNPVTIHLTARWK